MSNAPPAAGAGDATAGGMMPEPGNSAPPPPNEFDGNRAEPVRVQDTPSVPQAFRPYERADTAAAPSATPVVREPEPAPRPVPQFEPPQAETVVRENRTPERSDDGNPAA
jgi:hypothetical protein